MTKETQTQAIAEPFKFKNAALLNRLSEMAQVPYYATACHTLIQAEMAIVELERENAALRAEVERLAAQSAPAETSAVVSAPKFTRLKFFRDLSNDERMRMLRVFMDLSTIPDDAIKTHGVQRQLFDRVFAVAQSAQAPAQAVQEARCACNDRPASECPGEWEPGCDLGNNPKYVRAYVDAGRTIPPSGEIGGA